MKWTNEIIETAKNLLLNENKTYAEISQMLSCSKKSLGNKFSYLGIVKPKIKQSQILRICLFCNKSFTSNQARSKFCSRSCSARYNNPSKIQSFETRQRIAMSLALNDDYVYKLKTKELFCLNCKNPLKRYQTKYCNNTCASDHKSKLQIDQWLKGQACGHINSLSYQVLTSVRKWVFDRAKHKCENCGCDKHNPYTSKSILQIEHIDGNASNDRPENLKVLCPTCHAMTKYFGNAGSHRSARYEHRKNYRDKNMEDCVSGPNE